jgi:hypothetical protein
MIQKGLRAKKKNAKPPELSGRPGETSVFPLTKLIMDVPFSII